MRSYNIGTECYALLTSTNYPEVLIPVQAVILEKYALNNKNTYKIKIKDVFETDFEYLKEYFPNIKHPTTLKESNYGKSLVKRDVMKSFNNKTEFLTYMSDKPFFIEENYITLDKDGLKDLYCKFVKYLINFHYQRLFQLTSRSFLANTPIYENQKNMFIKRVNKIGFEDMFKRFGVDLMI